MQTWSLCSKSMLFLQCSVPSSQHLLGRNGEGMGCIEAPAVIPQYSSSYPGNEHPTPKRLYSGARNPGLICQHLPGKEHFGPILPLPGDCSAHLPHPAPARGCCGLPPPLFRWLRLGAVPSPRGGPGRGRWERAAAPAPRPLSAVPSRAALAALGGRAGLREEPREEPRSAALCRQPPQDGRKGRRAPAALAPRPPRAASLSSVGREGAQEGRRGRGRTGFRNGVFQPLLRCCSRQPRAWKAVGLLEEKKK